MKIRKKDVYAFMLMFFFIEPSYLQIFGIVHSIYNIMTVLATSYLVILYVLRKKIPSLTTIFLGGVIVTMLVACNFGAGNYQSTLSAYLSYFGLMLWFDYYMDKDIHTMMKSVCSLLDIYVFINFLTLVLFPSGLYISQSYQATPYICWFLGYKNPQMRFLLPYLALAFLWDYMRNGRIGKVSYIRLFVVAFATLKLGSTTGLVGVIVFLALIATFKNSGKIKNAVMKLLNLKLSYFVIMMLAALIIFFNFQYNFSYLIVNVLHKDLDLTDRIYVWQKVIPYIKEHLWIGSGVLYAPYSRQAIGASHAHNYYLNTVYNGGIVSLILLSGCWIVAGAESKKYLDSQCVKIVVFMLIVFLVMGITESLTSTILLYPFLVLATKSRKIVKYERGNRINEKKQK